MTMAVISQYPWSNSQDFDHDHCQKPKYLHYNAAKSKICLKSCAEAAQYTVTTYTYDKDNADTNDDVYISLIGSKGITTEYEADNDGDDRERGQEDIYKFTRADIGEFQCVLIRKEGDNGWLIEKVCLQIKSEKNFLMLQFNFIKV